MKVVNFKETEFERFVTATIDFQGSENILVLGVAHGGIPIANITTEILKKKFDANIKQGAIVCQRPSTKNKKKSPDREKLIKLLFSITPKIILDKLRIIEHKKLSKRAAHDMVRDIQFDRDILNLADFDSILVVDDAVDSGASLKAITEHLLGMIKNKELKIVTLAAALTQESPVFEPDFACYKNVLVRFPWSLDAKNCDF